MRLQNMTFWRYNMLHLTKITFFIALTALSFQIMAANSLQVIDRGQDGNERYYSVACADGSTKSVVVHFKETKRKEVSEEVLKTRTGNAKPAKAKITNICAEPGSDNEKCSASWDVQAAAKASCK